jgi:hypothetical protein
MCCANVCAHWEGRADVCERRLVEIEFCRGAVFHQSKRSVGHFLFTHNATKGRATVNLTCPSKNRHLCLVLLLLLLHSERLLENAQGLEITGNLFK